MTAHSTPALGIPASEVAADLAVALHVAIAERDALEARLAEAETQQRIDTKAIDMLLEQRNTMWDALREAWRALDCGATCTEADHGGGVDPHCTCYVESVIAEALIKPDAGTDGGG